MLCHRCGDCDAGSRYSCWWLSYSYRNHGKIFFWFVFCNNSAFMNLGGTIDFCEGMWGTACWIWPAATPPLPSTYTIYSVCGMTSAEHSIRTKLWTIMATKDPTAEIRLCAFPLRGFVTNAKQAKEKLKISSSNCLQKDKIIIYIQFCI